MPKTDHAELVEKMLLAGIAASLSQKMLSKAEASLKELDGELVRVEGSDEASWICFRLSSTEATWVMMDEGPKFRAAIGSSRIGRINADHSSPDRLSLLMDYSGGRYRFDIDPKHVELIEAHTAA